ncbi:MAG: hypothetical protein KGL48_06325 [Sphingomonadales bacterium]|nr:hypothetical protein [Sphingomonadales bacterium]MDE2569987.1 hypothetical protein [Sphingomonadales bacterium]
MRPARSILALLAAAALLQSQAAVAQGQCLTEAEVTGMAAFSLPSALEGVMKRCQPSLSPRGFFATNGPAMVQRYGVGKDAAWPAAKAAFLKLGADRNDQTMRQVSRLSDEALKPFVEGMVEQMVGDQIKPSSCVAIEQVSSLLEPLPARNTSQLIGFIVTLVESGKPDGKSRMPICKGPLP